MQNEKLRLFLRGKGVTLWQLCERMGISEPTMTRRLRRELTPEEAQEIKQLANEIARERSGWDDEVECSEDDANTVACDPCLDKREIRGIVNSVAR